MSKKLLDIPKFSNEADEADWWASAAGREFVKRKSAGNVRDSSKVKGLDLVARLNNKPSVQIAIRLPEDDIAKAREIADRKGIGYQTLLKMYVREGLLREAAGR